MILGPWLDNQELMVTLNEQVKGSLDKGLVYERVHNHFKSEPEWGQFRILFDPNGERKTKPFEIHYDSEEPKGKTAIFRFWTNILVNTRTRLEREGKLLSDKLQSGLLGKTEINFIPPDSLVDGFKLEDCKARNLTEAMLFVSEILYRFWAMQKTELCDLKLDLRASLIYNEVSIDTFCDDPVELDNLKNRMVKNTNKLFGIRGENVSTYSYPDTQNDAVLFINNLKLMPNGYPEKGYDKRAIIYKKTEKILRYEISNDYKKGIYKDNRGTISKEILQDIENQGLDFDDARKYFEKIFMNAEADYMKVIKENLDFNEI